MKFSDSFPLHFDDCFYWSCSFKSNYWYRCNECETKFCTNRIKSTQRGVRVWQYPSYLWNNILEVSRFDTTAARISWCLTHLYTLHILSFRYWISFWPYCWIHLEKLTVKKEPEERIWGKEVYIDILSMDVVPSATDYVTTKLQLRSTSHTCRMVTVWNQMNRSMCW